MANTKSAKKAARVAVRRTTINSARRSQIRSAIKKVETAVKKGDVKAANEALKAAKPHIQRGVTKGVLKKNTAARKISRLNAAVKKIAVKK